MLKRGLFETHCKDVTRTKMKLCEVTYTQTKMFHFLIIILILKLEKIHQNKQSFPVTNQLFKLICLTKITAGNVIFTQKTVGTLWAAIRHIGAGRPYFLTF